MSSPFAFRTAFICLVLAVLTAREGRAATALLDAAKDNTLYGDATKSNGAGPYIAAGRTNQTLPAALRRAVIEFDLSPLPAGATITDATLCLSFLAAGSPASSSVGLYRVQQEWGEGTSTTTQGVGANATTGDATWHHTFFATATWNTDGGDYAPGASATATVGTTPGCTNWNGPALVQDIQDWLDDPQSNHGWIVIGDEGTSQSIKQFASRENATLPHPLLTVTYDAPPGAGAVPESISEGAPLVVDKNGDALLELSWGGSCRLTDTDFEIYQGTMDGTFESHAQVSCSTGGATSASIAAPDASSYYLVVPASASVEGSYGAKLVDGSVAERPAAAAGCLPQAIDPCSP